MQKKHIWWIIGIIIILVVLLFSLSLIQTESYSLKTNCSSNYHSDSRTVRYAVTDEKDELVLDENGNKIIKTTQEARSTLSILCECDITYNDKTQNYTFEINHSYDRELTEEQQDCNMICKKICNEKLEELKSEK